MQLMAAWKLRAWEHGRRFALLRQCSIEGKPRPQLGIWALLPVVVLA